MANAGGRMLLAALDLLGGMLPPDPDGVGPAGETTRADERALELKTVLRQSLEKDAEGGYRLTLRRPLTRSQKR